MLTMFCGVQNRTQKALHTCLKFPSQNKPLLEAFLPVREKKKALGNMYPLHNIFSLAWLKKLALNVGVRRPFSKVKGSGTKATAFASSKPLNFIMRKQANVQVIKVRAVSIIIMGEDII